MTTADEAEIEVAEGPAAQLLGRLVHSLLSAMDLLLIYLGGQLGLYRALDEHGPASSTELAHCLGLDERYVREWLQAQAVSGMLTSAGTDPATARFGLPDGAREVLLDELSPQHGAPLAGGLAAVARALPGLLAAYHSGEGVPPTAYGTDFVALQAAGSRAMYLNDLAARWVPAIPVLRERLTSSGPVRVADVGCGGGWAAVALARAFPQVTVDGFDIQPTAVELARHNASLSGVADRVSFEVRDVSTDGLAARPYDVITLFNCLHEFAHPVAALRAIRRNLAPGAVVIVQEDNAPDTLAAPGDIGQRFIAGSSALICLPQSRVDPSSAGIGAMMGPAMVRQQALLAGYLDVGDLPVGDLRFYHLITAPH